jgi:hypothetical protein
MKIHLGLIALLALAAGCLSDTKKSMQKDAHGNYATTANYNAMERDEFGAAMRSGLRDFDTRLASLKTEAEALGPASVEEYHDSLDELQEGRRVFAAEIERHDAMLAPEWRSHRESVAEMYEELREDLDDAYESVVDET